MKEQPKKFVKNCICGNKVFVTVDNVKFVKSFHVTYVCEGCSKVDAMVIQNG